MRPTPLAFDNLMTAESTSKNPPRRPWWRFFVQFSLRSLLAVITLAAIACWWFLQPQISYTQLAGTPLTISRQVRMIKARPDQLGSPFAVELVLSKGETFAIVNVGRWQLRDASGDVLVAGHYKDNRPHGKWTVYHP